MARTLSLVVRNLVFTVVVPGLGGVWVPWSILTRHGRTDARRRGRALPLGAQPDLHRRAAGRPGGGVAVHVAAAAGVRGRHGGLLPPVRHRLRRAEAGPPLRPRLPGVPAPGSALDPPPAAPRVRPGGPANRAGSRPAWPWRGIRGITARCDG